MATVNLGSIKFNWRGAWSSSTAYAVDDVVSLSGSSYISIQAGTNQNPSTATAYWEQMSSAGTDGTDLTTTLTTQGDILYRDGSGLARLGAGTSGQVLQTGGTGANPSWGTVSSDWVKLHSASDTSVNVGSVDVLGYFDDTIYHGYKFYLSNWKFTAGAQPSFSFLNTSNNQVNSNNYLVLHTGYHASSGASQGQQDRGYWNSGFIADLEGTWGPTHSASGTDYMSVEAWICNPQSTSRGKHMNYQFHTFATSNGVHIVANGNYFHDSTTEMNGFRFKGDTQNTIEYNWALYGIKK